MSIVRGVLIVFGAAAALTLAVFVVQWIASESAEVVVIHTTDSAGAIQSTRLWVVDYEREPYLRSGADGSGWFARLQENPRIRFERNGESGEYVAEPRPSLSAEINALMREKYGWRDRFISLLLGGREGSIPIRLRPAASG